MSATRGENMSDTMVVERPQTRQDVRVEERQAPARQEQHPQPAPAMIPRVDVLEDQTGITLLADLPGVAREALEIHVEGDSLTIEGTVSAATPESMQAAYAEVRVPRYRRSFTLSRELDGGRIEAQLADGVLRLRIPKQEHAQPRRVSIQVA
jgi:HSP20 family molecular chaperone IbpA